MAWETMGDLRWRRKSASAEHGNLLIITKSAYLSIINCLASHSVGISTFGSSGGAAGAVGLDD